MDIHVSRIVLENKKESVDISGIRLRIKINEKKSLRFISDVTVLSVELFLLGKFA